MKKEVITIEIAKELFKLRFKKKSKFEYIDNFWEINLLDTNRSFNIADNYIEKWSKYYPAYNLNELLTFFDYITFTKDKNNWLTIHNWNVIEWEDLIECISLQLLNKLKSNQI